MKIYELVNPSDHIEFKSHSEHAAVVAVLILGEGKYGIRTADDSFNMPIFLLGGTKEWLDEKGMDLHETFTKFIRGPGMKELLYTLRSFRVVGRLTSMNYICSRAAKMADSIESLSMKMNRHD